jgi:hypothetical protein
METAERASRPALVARFVRWYRKGWPERLFWSVYLCLAVVPFLVLLLPHGVEAHPFLSHLLLALAGFLIGAYVIAQRIRFEHGGVLSRRQAQYTRYGGYWAFGMGIGLFAFEFSSVLVGPSLVPFVVLFAAALGISTRAFRN